MLDCVRASSTPPPPDGHCPLLGKAFINMGVADEGGANSRETAHRRMLSAESFQKPIRAPLLSALPPHQALKGDMFISMHVACDEPEWNATWADLKGREITVTVKLTQLETLPYQADRCYCQYEVGGELCTTDMDAMGQVVSSGPVDLNHIGIHEVHSASAELLDTMAAGELEVEIYASPCVADRLEPPDFLLDTNNLPLRRRYGGGGVSASPPPPPGPFPPPQIARAPRFRRDPTPHPSSLSQASMYRHPCRRLGASSPSLACPTRHSSPVARRGQCCLCRPSCR